MNMKQIFFKSNPIVDNFKELVKTGIVKSEEMNDTSLEQCVIYWIDHFDKVPKDDILKYPMKQEAIIFLKNLIQSFTKSLADNQFNPNYVLCLDHLSLFVPIKEDCNEIFMKFTNSIFDIKESIDIKYQSIFSKFLKALLANKNFQSITITQDNLILLWSTGLSHPPAISELIFDFLTESVRLTNQKKVKILTEPFQQLMIHSLKDVNVFALRFLCYCYNLQNDYVQLFEDHFNEILNAIKTCDDGLCFNDLLFIKAHDPEISINGFYELTSSDSPNLIKSLLTVVKENQSKIHFQIVMFLGSLKILDRDGQYLFLSLVTKDIIDLLFPPKLSHADCACLAVFSKTNVDRDKAIQYLNGMLIPNEKEPNEGNLNKNLNEDFEKRDGFNDLIVCLLSKLDAFDQVSDYFTQICYAQTPKIIPCLEMICQSFPPVSFLRQLVENAEILKNIGFFKSKFPFILRENMASITRELIKNKLFVEFIIKNEQYEVLQALSSDGPHPIIDKLLLSTEIPKKLSQEQIKCLIYDLPFNYNANEKPDLNEENVRFLAYKEKKMIRIPGLIPYLQDIEFNSLFDQSVAAQYLISNDFIHIDDPLFTLLGKQFLTPRYVNEIISKRIDILEKLTEDDHSLHKSVYQFKKGQNNSFISFDLPATIEFKVEKGFMKKSDYRNIDHLLLCTFSEFSIFVSSDSQIIYSSSNNFIKSTDSMLDCDLDKWHVLKISKVNSLHYNVTYDGVSFYPSNFEVNINKKLTLDSNILMINSLLVVGSPLLNPISTFYVHINRSNKIIQMGDGIVTAHYRGIYYYKSILNIENRLLKKALRTNDEEEFSHIVMSLIRFAIIKRKKYHNASLSASNLNKIRHLFIIKTHLLTDKLVNDIISQFSDFNLFEALNSLIDYDLWERIDFTPAFNFIFNLFMLDVSPTCSLTPKTNDQNHHSLLNNFLSFFLDLCEYTNKKEYFKKINDISTLFSFSGDLLYRFLEYQDFCDCFFKKNPSLLIKMIPLKYMIYLSNKTALLYLQNYSLSHTESLNEYISQPDMECLVSQTSFYSNFVDENSFWNSIITLLYAKPFDDITAINPDLLIKNEPILRIIFSLIPHLARFSINEATETKNGPISKIFYSITELVKTLFANNKISDVNIYLKELVEMIRMNCFATSLTPLPIIFKTFESDRKALSAVEYSPNINFNLISDIIISSKNIPEVDPISFSYFGIEIPYKKDPNARKQSFDEYERYFDSFDSFEFKQVFEIIIILIGLYDDDMKKTELLRCLFSCGIDTSTKTSMDFHQNYVMKYLERVGIDHAILTLLNETLLIGYWENNLLLLFDIIIKSYKQKISYPVNVVRRTKAQQALEIENDILVFELIMKIMILLNKDDFQKIPNESFDFILDRLRNLQENGSEAESSPNKNQFTATYMHYLQCITGIIDRNNKIINEVNSPQKTEMNNSLDTTDDGTDINEFTETTNTNETTETNDTESNDNNENKTNSDKRNENSLKINDHENNYMTDTTENDSIGINMNSTNYSFLSSSTFVYNPNLINGYETIDEFLLNYKKSNESVIRELNKKYIEIRIKTVLSHYDAIYLTELNQKKRELSDNVRNLFEKRYNFYAQRNEETYFEMIKNLPRDPPTQYQIVSTVHPFSPPTLYVPYYSKCSCDNFKIYPKFSSTLEDILETHESDENSENESSNKDKKKEKKASDKNIFGASIEKSPRILFYNHNFTSYSFKMSYNEYVEFFIHYESQIDSIVDISLICCADTIPSVLIRNKDHFTIITFANTIENEKNKFTLIEPRLSLLASSFLDICASGFYGKTTLFFGHLVLMFDRDEITISIPRVFCFQYRAIEIWFEKGYSLYLIFHKEDKLEHDWNSILTPMKQLPYSESIFSLSFSSHITTSVKNKSDLVKFRVQWINNRISSFAYLLILNFYADRSFTNICQYFVMPWIQDERDLSKPMGMQNEERANDFREKYRTSFPDSHFYGSLYSSPAIVMRFMIRVQPFTNFSMDLQNGFDKADRLFFDIDNEYQSASCKSNHNVEEMIPELFMLPEIYLNINKIQFPKRMNGQTINNCNLPSNEKVKINNWVQFVWEYRKKLDDTPHLEKWIDLIFGVYSRGHNAIEKENLFYPSTYGIRPQYIDDHAFESLMMNFGQVPTQLFYEAHPCKNTLIFSRWPLLTETDSISFQSIHSNLIKHDFKNENDNLNSLTLVKSNGTFVIKSCMSLFEEVSHHHFDYYGDDDEFDTSQFHCCSFSDDRFFFCIVFESGTIFIYRAICEVETKISYYKHLSVCHLPETEANFVSLKATCVKASSHLFLVCEVIDRFIFCFQINGTFIRTIPCSTPVNKVMINDSYQSIFAIQNYQIEVFTINGTQIASINTADALVKYRITSKPDQQKYCKILSSSISLNDTSVYLATGHKNRHVVLWNIDPKLKILCVKKIIQLDTKLVINVDENKILKENKSSSSSENKNNHSININDDDDCDFDVKYVQVVSNGSALYAFCEKQVENADIERSFHLLTARETRKPLVSESAVLECASCGKKYEQNSRKKFIACNSCGAYFCNDCIQKSGGEVVCHDCLTHIAEYSDVIDPNV